LSQNLTLINYQNAQIICIYIEKEKSNKQEIDIDTEIETGEEKEVLLPSYIFIAQHTKDQFP